MIEQPENVWLSEVERRLAEGLPFDPRAMLVALRDRLPRGFTPAQISRDLLHGDFPSVEGLVLIGDPFGFLGDIERVILYIRARLIEDPGTNEITAAEVANSLSIAIGRAERVLLLATSLGHFCDTRNSTTGGCARIGIESPDVVSEYITFETLSELLTSREARRKEWLRIAAPVPPQPAMEESAPLPVRRLFLSHATADLKVARLLKGEVEARAPNMKVYLTSFPGMIPSGTDWLAHIKGELDNAECYIILLTPSSINRPWVLFETGAAWMSKRPMLTVCAGGLDRETVEMPLKSFQILSLEDPEEAASVFAQLGATNVDTADFTVSVASAANAHALSGWDGIQIGRRYFAWDGPTLHALPDRPPGPTPNELSEALRSEGWIPRFGLSTKLNHHLANGLVQVWETDRKTWRKALVATGDGGQVLLIGRAPA